MDRVNSLFFQFLLSSISGSFFVLGFLIIRKIFYHYGHKKWFYYFWLLAFFFFVIPIPKLSAISEIFPPFQQQKEYQEIEEKDNILPVEKEVIKEQEKEFKQQEQNSFVELTEWQKPIKEKRTLYPWIKAAQGVWLAGIFLIILSDVIQKRKFQKKLLEGRRNEAEKEYHAQVMQALEEERKILKIKKMPMIYYHDNISSPFFKGINHPEIYLPIDIPPEDIRIIIKHELIHYKRKDSIYHAIGRGITYVHWFNPFAWCMLVKLQEDGEFSCDEEVSKSMQEEEKRRYSKAILMTIYRARNRKGTGELAFSKKKSFTEERVREIMRGKTKKRWKTSGLISILLVIFMAGNYIVSAAMSSKVSASFPNIENMNATVSKETADFSQEFENIKVLKVHGYDGTVTIKEGKSFKVTANNLREDYEIKNIDGMLIIARKGEDWDYIYTSYTTTTVNNSGWSNINIIPYYNEQAEIIIEIPKNQELEEAVLFNHRGEFSVESLKTKKFYLDNGPGIFSIKEVYAQESILDGGSGIIMGTNNNLGKGLIDTGSGYTSLLNSTMHDIDIDTGSGDMLISGIITGNNIIDTGSGDVKLSLLGAKENYGYKVDTGSGDIKIAGKLYEDGRYGENKKNFFNIDSGSGDVTIDFETNIIQTDEAAKTEAQGIRKRIQQEIEKEKINKTNESSVKTTSQTSPNSPEEREVKTEEIDLTGIAKIDFKLKNICDVYIYTTKDNKIKVVQQIDEKQYTRGGTDELIQEREIFTVNKANNVLTIATQPREEKIEYRNKNFPDYGSDLYVYLPESYQEDLAIATNLGDIVFYDEITVKNVQIVENLGDIIIKKNFTAQQLNLENNLGDIVTSGFINAQSLNGVNNLGDVIIQGALEVDEIKVEASLGSICFSNDISCKIFEVSSSLGDCEINQPLVCDKINIQISMGELRANTLTAPDKRIITN